jgi:uncharacterized membrane protein
LKHQVATVALSVAFIALALLSGAHRRGALLGASASSFAALGSIFAMARVSRARMKPVHGALAVMAIAFLFRILLVGLGTAAVVHSGESVVAFVVAFFVPFFVFSAVEGAYVHSLNRGTGPTA